MPNLRPNAFAFAALVALLGACGGGDPVTPPVTPPATPPVGGTPTPPPGMVMVTVSASSTPVGATVTGGGTLLGTTPFVTSVPVPAPSPGTTQTFEFTFQLPGYTPTTITASPINSTINLNAVLAPMTLAVNPGLVPGTPGMAVPGTPGMPGMPGAIPGVTTGTVPPAVPGAPGIVPPPGSTFTVEGEGGGRIFDNHTTSASVDVAQICRMASLRVDIRGNHSFSSDMIVRLRSPAGETFTLQNHARRSPFRTHTVERARGMMSAGHWTLSIEDNVGADGGALNGFSLEITCL